MVLLYEAGWRDYANFGAVYLACFQGVRRRWMVQEA